MPCHATTHPRPAMSKPNAVSCAFCILTSPSQLQCLKIKTESLVLPSSGIRESTSSCTGTLGAGAESGLETCLK
jgi:hypothetical protein